MQRSAWQEVLAVSSDAPAAPRSRALKWIAPGLALLLGLGAGVGLGRLVFSPPAPSTKGEAAMFSDAAGSHGIIIHRSPWALEPTLQRLQAAFKSKGIKVFYQVDQQAEARAVGLDQPPMHLLLVGSPRAGTPVMAAAPQAGLDLPLKVLVWEAPPGEVQVGLNSADYLAARHGLTPELAQPLRGLEALVKGALTE
jgi:uncharacterized protein (DUF302 family)